MNSSQLPAKPASQATELQLHDIHLPEPASWWPPAPGWWIVFFTALLLIGWISLKLYQLLKKQRWKKRLHQAFNSDLSQLEALNDSQFMTEISSRLRRLALTLFPSADVASLSGQQWLEFLDQHSSQPYFSQHPASLLIVLPYHNAADKLERHERKQVITLARQWAKHNIKQGIRDAV